jgi:hypothetical protein
MHELDPAQDGQPDPEHVSRLHEQAEQLRQQDGTIGYEGGEPDDTTAASGAHDPMNDIDTSGIGNGHDDVQDHIEPAAADETAAAVELARPAETPGVTEHISALATSAAIEPVTAAGEAEDIPEPADTPLETTEPTTNEATAAAPEVSETVAVPAETDAAPVADTPAETDTPADEFGDTRITEAEVHERYAQWEAGEVVESSSTPIAEFKITPEEEAILRAVDLPYDIISQGTLGRADHPHSQKVTGMSEEQLRTLHEIDQRFVAAVAADAERNGFGPPSNMQHVTAVGNFGDNYSDVLDWHVDRFGEPTLRYVLALGDAGATRFAHGPNQKDQTDQSGSIRDPAYVNTAPGGTHQEVKYPHGVIVRFMSNTDWHATPTEEGFRVFFTTSVRVPQYRML